MHRRSVLAALGAVAAPATFAQAPFPSQPVSWIVPYPTGGFGDAMSRIMAAKVASRLRHTVIVENRPGGAAQVGANAVLQRPADGHTLFYADIGPLAMYPSLYTKLSFDPLRDFAPITRLFSTPTVLVVSAASPFKTFADLLRAAKAEPGLSYGSYGIGSQPHVWTEQLRRRTGSRMVHVPYQGAGAALQDLMGGRLDFMVDVIASSLPLARDGKLRALALIGSGGKRAALLLDVPTVTELGHEPLDVAGWNGVMARAGSPAPVIEQLHGAIVEALQSAEVLQRYSPLGLVPAPLSPAAFGEFIRSESNRWGAAIRETGIKVE